MALRAAVVEVGGPEVAGPEVGGPEVGDPEGGSAVTGPDAVVDTVTAVPVPLTVDAPQPDRISDPASTATAATDNFARVPISAA